MTKKHFVAIAAIIKTRLDYIAEQMTLEHDNEVMERFVGSRNDAEILARDFADYFRTVNAEFDRVRFLTACGLKGGHY